MTHSESEGAKASHALELFFSLVIGAMFTVKSGSYSRLVQENVVKVRVLIAAICTNQKSRIMIRILSASTVDRIQHIHRNEG